MTMLLMPSNIGNLEFSLFMAMEEQERLFSGMSLCQNLEQLVLLYLLLHLQESHLSFFLVAEQRTLGLRYLCLLIKPLHAELKKGQTLLGYFRGQI